MAKIFASVLIDTYNHERFIEQAIVSVLEQDFPAADREIIVVDDGSTDRTAEIVKKFGPRVRLLRKENGGQASAFNAGIPECKGEIIAFLDGDDWWAREKLLSVSEILATDPAVGMVGHAIIESFDNGKEKIVALERQERLRLTTVRAAQVFRLHRAYLGASRLTLRAEIAKRILPVPEELEFEADEYLFTLAAVMADFVILKDAMSHYRIHGGNLFVAANPKSGGLQRKQRVLAALFRALRRELPTHGASREVADCMLEMVGAEATQLRLMVNGGASWETYSVESTVYRIHHADASWTQKLYRQLTMIPALVLPPKWFYAAKRRLARQPWYIRIREKYLPMPGITKMEAPEQTHE